MTEDLKAKRLHKVLNSMLDEPESLYSYLVHAFPGLPAPQTDEIPELIDLLLPADTNSEIHLKFANLLRRWDNADGREKWVAATERNTRERRNRVYQLLLEPALDHLSTRIDQLVARYEIAEPVIIATDHKDWFRQGGRQRDFYWGAYRSYLLETKRWHEESVIALDNSTTAIIERLADPTQREVFKARGLVVGYVQSGKTANFTGLIAKAIDAGYRLIIVLAGTWNMLRSQTQRRIDKELVGKELLEDQTDYRDKPEDWEEFVAHNGRPADLGAFNIERLTDISEDAGDYRHLRAAIGALDFDFRDRSKPLNDPVNLHHLPARVIVMKKHPVVIDRLKSDLDGIRAPLQDVPALVIDDESDQAGLNTVKPTGTSRKNAHKRTSTNKSIVDLLATLPRCQYIGYTATPYANALINPNDEADLFPRHFILSLEKPKGYMGISDFFDPDVPTSELPKDDFSYSERAFVRDGFGADHPKYRETLKMALGCFVLSGAIKLYRRHQDGSRYRGLKHHTMLVHTSVGKAAQSVDRDHIQEVFEKAAFSSRAGLGYLEKIWADDFVPVSDAQGAGELMPRNFSELEPFIGACLDKIDNGRLTRVLNSDTTSDPAPDFEEREIWEIIVGGNKLSRGFTVEGLTISYYLRTAKTADTLMQMGRWFGFRGGYSDLVRIFVGRSQGRRAVDLIDKFKQACLIEERFREDVKRYSKKVDGAHLRPIDVPPLVAIVGDLEPVARNKKWNAIIKEMNFAESWGATTLMPNKVPAMEENLDLCRGLWRGASDKGALNLGGRIRHRKSGKTEERVWPAAVRAAELSHFIDFLVNFQWLRNKQPPGINLQIDFLRRRGNGVSEVLLVAPQLQRPIEPFWIDNLTVRVRERDDDGSGRFQQFGEPAHRAAAEFITDRPNRFTHSSRCIESPSADLQKLQNKRALVCLLYPCRPDGSKEPVTIGFELLFPSNNLPRGLSLTTEVPNSDAPIVDATA